MTDFAVNLPGAINKTETTRLPRLRIAGWFRPVRQVLGALGASCGKALEMALVAPFQAQDLATKAPDEDLEGRDPNW